MEIKYLPVQFRLEVVTLRRQAEVLAERPEQGMAYTSDLDALDELVDAYDDLSLLMKEYSRLLEKECVRLSKADTSLTEMDKRLTGFFR